jgi:3-hydroxybutyryl-CoA dehydratase
MPADDFIPMIAPHSFLFFEDLAVGQRASLTRVAAGDELERFAEPGTAAGADSPADAPAFTGAFGQGIAYGMFTAGLVSAVLGTKLPGRGAVFLSQNLQFLAPVGAGDSVTAQVEVIELVPSRRRARLFCECVCDGKVVLEGEAWIALAAREARPGA